MQYLIKIIVTALVVVVVSELAKRFTTLAAILASLPLTSILAIIWLYYDTKNIGTISSLSINIFWAVLPSLLFFLVFPYFLKSGMKFGWSLLLSATIMFAAYSIYVLVLNKFGIKL